MRQPRKGESVRSRFASLSPLAGLDLGLAHYQGLTPLATDYRPYRG